MDEEEGGMRLSKRFSDKGGEVDYKTKAGTAWSHSYLNQKPWHPLSYPNQRRKWIAEQTHAQRERRSDEVSREYAQEQEFFRQTALVSKKEKEKMEMMKAVSFMYVRPPGYNAESAKAADLADERKKQEQEEENCHGPSETGSSMPTRPEAMPSGEEKKKSRPKDVFGRAVPTEEQFEVLKNAPRLETGVAARSKPFGVEIRNVKCLRCGNYGHQSGDRECPLKDAIMPSEESRLKRDDPLTAILAQTDFSEPLKWELKQKPGLSPPRGGFKADDPNQQIVAEDIFDEYGGFLGGDDIPELLTNFYSSNPKKKTSRERKQRRKLSPSSTKLHDPERGSSSSDDDDRSLKNQRAKKLVRKHLRSSSPENSHFDSQYNAEDSNKSSAGRDRSSRLKQKRNDKKLSRMQESGLQYDTREYTSSSSDDRERRHANKKRHKRKSGKHSESSQSDYLDSDKHKKRLADNDRERKSSNKERHGRKSRKSSYSSQSDDSDYDRHHKRSSRHRHSHRSTSENSDSEGPYRKKRDHRHRHRHRH